MTKIESDIRKLVKHNPPFDLAKLRAQNDEIESTSGICDIRNINDDDYDEN